MQEAQKKQESSLFGVRVYNTLSKQIENFKPMGNRVNMFVCGPTVYDYIHIGNARTFVFFDVVAKYLRHKGYEVNYIQNITDIDNKIIERAQKEGVDSLEYAKKYAELFKEDMQALGITSPEYKNATDHIPEVIKQVQTLLDKGNAYVIKNDPAPSLSADPRSAVGFGEASRHSEKGRAWGGAGGIYFDISTFPDYGKLSGRTAGMADDAVSRIDDSDKKRNRGDFALWKFSQTGDPSWDFETGKYLGINDGRPAFAKAMAGRPGWHIEDTAITEKYFGPQYDIHGGGQDLIFPHHEAEVTQQCAAANIKPKDFVKYWMHVAFVVNPVKSSDDHGAGKKQKMSKSLGNFETVHELLKKHSKEVLRFYLLSGYYRSPLDFSEKILVQSTAAIQRISEFKRALEITDQKGQGNVFKYNDKVVNPAESERIFFESLDNDFNTQEAFGHLFGLIRALNLPLRMGAVSKEYARPVLGFLDKVNEILRIIPTSHIEIPKEVMKLITKREGLREQQNWLEADKIRAQIEEMGYRVEDTIYGPLVSR